MNPSFVHAPGAVPVPSQPPHAGRLRALLAAIGARWLAASDRRRSLHALSRLDPRLLEDIGVSQRAADLALRNAGLTFASSAGPQGAANW